MAKLPVIAVAGGTGELGRYITDALLLPEFRSKFDDVIILSRNSNSPAVKIWTERGVNARTYSVDDDDSIDRALQGVDVLISAVGKGDGHILKEKLVTSIISPSSSVKLYFPSEFGVDHTLHEFAHPEWDRKKQNYNRAITRKELKVCRVMIGLFLEHSIGPWFGFNTKEGKYESIGSGETPISFTSISDVGKAIASVIANVPINNVPDKIVLSGDAKSLRDVAKIMEQTGSGEIAISTIELDNYRQEVLKSLTDDPAPSLRFLMAEGKIEYQSKNDNELVNPGGKLWKWKTVEDLGIETHGRPWADY